MKLYKKLHEAYNRDVNKIIRNYTKANKSRAKLKPTLTYLIKCRKLGLVPKFISNSTRNVENLFHFDKILENETLVKIKSLVLKYIEKFNNKILNLIIKQKHFEINKTEIELDNNKTLIQQHISDKDYYILCQSEAILYNSNLKKTTQKQIKKLQELKTIRENKQRIKHNKDWFINKTNIVVPTNIQKLLSLGPKFALPIQKQNFPLFKCIADGEDIIQTNTDKENQDIARSKFVAIIDNYLNKRTITTTEREIINTVEETKKFLNKNTNILILKSDKGNKTVAIERTDYERKMENILQDICTYKRIKTDPTLRLQARNNKLVEKLLKQNVIDGMENHKLTTYTAIAPRIYGLPKIHKDGMPLRPICSSVNSPSFGLCKYIVNILKNLTKNSKYNVKDALDFKTKMDKTQLLDDEVLISFDVISLFPSIPVNLALEIIKNKWDTISANTNISKDLFFDILNFCLKENRYFKYDNKTYEQLKGMPMGSPASPVVADIVMEELLDTVINNLEQKPRCVSKYVDDLFCIIKRNNVEKTLQALNGFHRRIQFTKELEHENKLPYLDTLIVRDQNKICINWYQKDTASGRLINFFSNHPKYMIMNTAKNFTERVLRISDEIYHKENMKTITNILQNNSFPLHTIKDIIKNALKNLNRPPEIRPEKLFKSMTFVPKFSERITFSDIYDKQNINIALKTDNTLNLLFSNTKNKIDRLDKTNLVYRIPCNGDGSNTCDKLYVGTTRTKLRSRLAAHKSNYNTRNNYKEQKTALASHCAETGHSPNINNTVILQHENNNKKRYTIEMLHIINTPAHQRINYKTDTENCAHTYRHIIKKHKQST